MESYLILAELHVHVHCLKPLPVLPGGASQEDGQGNAATQRSVTEDVDSSVDTSTTFITISNALASSFLEPAPTSLVVPVTILPGTACRDSCLHQISWGSQSCKDRR